MSETKIWVGARRSGKEQAMREMERDFILDHPNTIVVRPRPNGDVIIEKPVKAVPQRALPSPADLAAYQGWCVQMGDGEVPPMSFEDWLRERARRRAEGEG